MGDAWKEFLDGYIAGCPKSFWALALGYANPEDLGTLFTATDSEGGENAWAPFYADPHQVEVEGQSITMDETAHLSKLLQAIENEQQPPARYLYLGSEKYQDTEMVEDNKYCTIMFAGPGKGGCIVKGPTYFVIGLFKESLDQTKGACGADVFKVAQAANAS